MAEPAPRRVLRRRWWRRRKALPPSRRALALAAVLTVVIAGLLALGIARSRPGAEVPAYDPAATTTTTTGPVRAPVITAVAPIRRVLPPLPGGTTTTRRHR